CVSWCGSVGSGGPLNNVLRERKPNWAWITMRCANTRGGIITCSRVCWPISSSGTCRAGWNKKAPALTVSQVRRVLKGVLPVKAFQADEVLQLIAGMQQRQHRAYLSHRKRRLHELPH